MNHPDGVVISVRSALYPADTSWSAASAELTESTDPLGRIEST